MFSFIKSLFSRRPSAKTLAILQDIARMAVLAVERPGVAGVDKKSESLRIVGGTVKQMGLPVPPLLVDVAIEAAVRALPRGGAK